jgi:hypothetical protein
VTERTFECPPKFKGHGNNGNAGNKNTRNLALASNLDMEMDMEMGIRGTGGARKHNIPGYSGAASFDAQVGNFFFQTKMYEI